MGTGGGQTMTNTEAIEALKLLKAGRGSERIFEAIDYAIKAIKKQSESYQSIPEADEWIPVGERLPEVGLGGVLVLIESIPPEHYEQFQKVANYDESGWICQYAYGRHTKITHWRYLPEPPKTEKP
jgi:hypothetical protein